MDEALSWLLLLDPVPDYSCKLQMIGIARLRV
jgi:hypothetical protein